MPKTAKSIDNKGIIKIGDDLYDFVEKNDIKIRKISLLKRILKSILGIINRKLLKKRYLNKLKKYNESLKINKRK